MDLTQIIGFRGGIRDDLRGTARPHRHAETTLERRYEPQNGGHHGHFSNSLVIYGATIGSMNIVMWNVIAIATNYLTVGAYMYFRRQEART